MTQPQPPMQQPPADKSWIQMEGGRPKKKSKLPWILGGVALVLLLCCGGIGIAANSGDTTKNPTASEQTTAAPAPTTAAATEAAPSTNPPTTAPVTTAPPKPVAPPAATIEDGTWVVGEDFPAGKYRVVSPVTELCYWEISKAGSNGSDIIANDLPEGGRPSVTLKKGQEFKTDCGTWRKVG